MGGNWSLLNFALSGTKGTNLSNVVAFMTGPPKLYKFRHPCSTQLHTLTETVEAGVCPLSTV